MADPHEQRPRPDLSPGEGQRIIRRYTDAETGLLVIEQVATNARDDPQVFCRLFDPQSGLPIAPETRTQQLGDAVQTHVDHAHQLQLTTRRVVDAHTGGEFYHETLVDLQTGAQVAYSRSVAFSPTPRRTALEGFLEAQEAHHAAQQFWLNEYPQRSFAEQCGYWLGYCYRTMRIMGERGQPEHGLFTPANYREWKTLDPQFDRILVYLLRELPRLFDGDAELPRRISALLEPDAGT